MTTALVPINELQQMGDAIAGSGLFGIKTQQQAVALMLVAQAEGLHPATVAQDYDIIQGRPARRTHSVLARFQAAGGTVQWHDFSETKVSGTFTHPKGGALKVDWTTEMARKAGLADKDNWKKTPRAMLRARCIAEGVRATYPAALGGSLIVEEAADLALEALADGGEAKPQVPQRKSATSAPKDAEDIPFKEAATPAAPPAPVVANGGSTITANQVKYLQNKLSSLGIDAAAIDAMLARFNTKLDTTMTVEAFDGIRAELTALS